MKKLVFISIISLFLIPLSFSQSPKDVTNWSFSFEQQDSSVTVTATASIEPGWKIYGPNISEGGPNKTTFGLESPNGFILEGDVKEVIPAHEAFDSIFSMNIAYYKEKCVIQQTYKTTGANNILEGFVEFQACNDEECYPPKQVPFKYDLSKKSITTESKIATLDGTLPIWHTNPKETSIVYASPDDDTRSKDFWTTFILAFLGGFAALLTPCVFPMIPFTVSYFTKQSKSRAHGVRSAIIYGFSIMIIYVLLGTGIVALFGASSLNALSTNAVFNLIFFLILIIFAASFMGGFEITLPSSWANASDRGVDKGGFLGIFFMAFTLALVSFSCTGPIVGTLLVAAASSGSLLAPAIGMLGFSLAIAIPFAIFAAFPGWLNSLPKSGGWMNSVKVVLAFIELGLALKFLSIADMVLKLQIFNREIFLALWIAISILLGLYLLGLIRFPHDSKSKPSILRVLLGVGVLIFAGYVIPGLWGSPVALISGFPPPSNYAESPFGIGNNSYSMSIISIIIICVILLALLVVVLYNLRFIGRKRGEASHVYSGFIAIVALALIIYILPVFSGAPVKLISWAVPGLEVKMPQANKLPDLMHYGPEGIPVFDDYEDALAYAKKVDKPLFLDFTGVGCVNCRKVEANVWSNAEIKDILTNDYIVVSLEVDIKEELSKDKQYISPYSGDRIKTIGNLWSDFQSSRFGTASQPFYVLVDYDREYFGTVKAMDLDVDSYKQWLLDNLKLYKERNRKNK